MTSVLQDRPERNASYLQAYRAHSPCAPSLYTNPSRQVRGTWFILHAKALHGSPYDGHTLKSVIDELTE